MNRKHVEVLGGERTMQECVEEINSGGAKATDTFLKRLQYWKSTVQVNHKYHDDPHKLFPQDKPPVPFYTRMLAVNMQFGKEPPGVFTVSLAFLTYLLFLAQAFTYRLQLFCRWLCICRKELTQRHST